MDGLFESDYIFITKQTDGMPGEAVMLFKNDCFLAIGNYAVIIINISRSDLIGPAIKRDCIHGAEVQNKTESNSKNWFASLMLLRVVHGG